MSENCISYVLKTQESMTPSAPSLFMLAPGKMACKVVFVYTHVSTDVTLERMRVAMTAHMNGVEDIVREVNITVLAFM